MLINARLPRMPLLLLMLFMSVPMPPLLSASALLCSALAMTTRFPGLKAEIVFLQFIANIQEFSQTSTNNANRDLQ